MAQLLDEVLDAHGGRERWSRVTGLTARVSLGGAFWAGRGWPEAWQDTTVQMSTTRERIAFTDFPAAGDTVIYEAADGERIWAIDRNGAVGQERCAPRASFPPYSADIGWDALQTAYFTSVAVWNYLMEPFLFTWPGVSTEEIEPWDEGGQPWRRLAVHFPDTLPNHNPDQVFYYDDDMRQRRMDYRPEVTGAPAAHYTYDPVDFDGFTFYTRRIVRLHDENGITYMNVAPITLDIANVEVHTS